MRDNRLLFFWDKGPFCMSDYRNALFAGAGCAFFFNMSGLMHTQCFFGVWGGGEAKKKPV